MLFSIIVVALVAAGVAAWQMSRPAPEIAVPKDLASLEPQLRDHISEHLERARQRPRSAENHATLGLIYAVNGLWFEARQAFETAASLNPSNPLPAMYVGVSLQELGDLNDAIAAFQRVTVRFPDFAPAFYRLGYALLRGGRLDEAERAFRRLTELAPPEWRGHAALGEIRIRQNRHAEAIPFLEKALQLEFGAKTIHHLLGQACQNLGRVEEAELHLQLGKNATESPMPDAWTKLAPQHIRILQEQTQLANDLADAGEPDKAVAVLSQALAYHPNDANVANQLAIALNRAGQPAQARALIKGALQKHPDHLPLLITLSFSEHLLNDNGAALAAAERALALAPNLAQGHIARANALLGMERDEDALRALESAARLDPQNAEIAMEMGDILWRNLDRKADAKQRYEVAVRLNPALVPAYARLADLALESESWEEARAAIARLRRLAPNMPDVAILEARLRKATGNKP